MGPLFQPKLSHRICCGGLILGRLSGAHLYSPAALVGKNSKPGRSAKLHTRLAFFPTQGLRRRYRFAPGAEAADCIRCKCKGGGRVRHPPFQLSIGFGIFRCEALGQVEDRLHCKRLGKGRRGFRTLGRNPQRPEPPVAERSPELRPNRMVELPMGKAPKSA